MATLSAMCVPKSEMNGLGVSIESRKRLTQVGNAQGRARGKQTVRKRYSYVSGI